jgi:hypothetical protein
MRRNANLAAAAAFKVPVRNRAPHENAEIAAHDMNEVVTFMDVFVSFATGLGMTLTAERRSLL